MREYQLTVDIAVNPSAEEVEEGAERMLDAFERTHPKAGAAAGGDLLRGRVGVTFSVDALDINEALDIGRRIHAAVANAAGIGAAEVVAIEAEAVPADELEDELQPA